MHNTQTADAPRTITRASRLLAHRLAPCECLTIDDGARVTFDGQHWTRPEGHPAAGRDRRDRHRVGVVKKHGPRHPPASFRTHVAASAVDDVHTPTHTFAHRREGPHVTLGVARRTGPITPAAAGSNGPGCRASAP